MSNFASHVLFSKPEDQRTGTPLLVMFHGYGSNEADLFSLKDALPQEFTVASVRAGLAAGPGFAWFPLRSDLSYDDAAVVSAVTEMTQWLDTVKEGHSSVTLLGFSQGMCMATALVRHLPNDFAAVVGLSGFVHDAHGDPFYQDAALAERKMPIFWGRDQADPVIPAESVEYTNTWLREHFTLTKVLYTGIWHGINAQEIAHVGEFLRGNVLS
ncbi:MAG: phospholipase [Acidobacteria bacterium]|nr:phospholipase [Acidobacteriota bacterium]